MWHQPQMIGWIQLFVAKASVMLRNLCGKWETVWGIVELFKQTEYSLRMVGSRIGILGNTIWLPSLAFECIHLDWYSNRLCRRLDGFSVAICCLLPIFVRNSSGKSCSNGRMTKSEKMHTMQWETQRLLVLVKQTYIVGSLDITNAYQACWCTGGKTMFEKLLCFLQLRAVTAVALEHWLQNGLAFEVLFVRATLIIFGVFLCRLQMLISNFFEFVLGTCTLLRFIWCFISRCIPSVCRWVLWRCVVWFFSRPGRSATMILWLCCGRRFFITSVVQRRHYANEMWNYTESPIYIFSNRNISLSVLCEFTEMLTLSVK